MYFSSFQEAKDTIKGKMDALPEGKFWGRNFAHGLFFNAFFEKKICQFAFFEAPFRPILMG